jgi:hypothetical protein
MFSPVRRSFNTSGPCHPARDYFARLELSSGWLVVFDQRSGQAPIAERTQVEDRRTPTGRAVAVIRA